MIRLALIGDPVAHSASPAFHREFLRERGLEGTYEALRTAAGDGARVLHDLGARGFAGVNVTTPLKEEAYEFCTRQDEVAAATGSVNTVRFAHGDALGCNTDGIGAIAALKAALAPTRTILEGAAVLVLGVGATGRAATFALRAAGARAVLWNRTAARAEKVAGEFNVAVWQGEAVDVVLATLPPNAELSPELVAFLRAAPAIVNANYGGRETLGALLGRPVTDGLEMLRAGARASFEVFTN